MDDSSVFYRKILKGYMRGVLYEEGVTHVGAASDLTETETAVLHSIAKELDQPEPEGPPFKCDTFNFNGHRCDHQCSFCRDNGPNV